MNFKLFKGNKLYFIKYIPYDGPIILMYCPPNTILQVENKYIVDIENKYYQLLEVKYNNIIYTIEEFVSIYPDSIGI